MPSFFPSSDMLVSILNLQNLKYKHIFLTHDFEDMLISIYMLICLPLTCIMLNQTLAFRNFLRQHLVEFARRRSLVTPDACLKGCEHEEWGWPKVVARLLSPVFSPIQVQADIIAYTQACLRARCAFTLDSHLCQRALGTP
jgi:hypothetical protein